MKNTCWFAIVIGVLATACGGGSSGAPCTVDSECNLAAVCRDNVCTAGCNDERDCPADRPICDSEGAGGCVTCLEDRDCLLPGLACVAGDCRVTCSTSAECNGGICDPATSTCIECVENSDCALGNVCLDNKCTAGCERDRDCPLDTRICVPADGDHGTCYECTDASGCPNGETCSDHHCTTQCTSNTQCPGQVCDLGSGVCVECIDDSRCALGSICESKACVTGCRINTDCPPATPTCDPAMGPHGTCTATPAGGGQGAACAATTECQAGFACAFTGTCARLCATTCPAPLTCQSFFDITFQPVMICQ